MYFTSGGLYTNELEKLVRKEKKLLVLDLQCAETFAKSSSIVCLPWET